MNTHIISVIYISALFMALFGTAIIILMTLRKENRQSPLYRALSLFMFSLFLYCILYFYFYFAENIEGILSVSLSLRICDYVLYGMLFIFWLMVLDQFCDQDRSRLFKSAYVIAALRILWGIFTACLTDEYYRITDSMLSKSVITVQSVLSLLAIITAAALSVMAIRDSISSRRRKYIIIVSMILCTWDFLQLFIDSSLISGRFTSAWTYGIPDTTSLVVFIMGLATFIFIFKEDFSPLFYADKNEVTSLEEVALEHGLTVRELDVLKLVYEGKNNPEIADALFISRNTVKKHLQNIYEKLDVNSRGELVYIVNIKKENSK